MLWGRVEGRHQIHITVTTVLNMVEEVKDVKRRQEREP